MEPVGPADGKLDAEGPSEVEGNWEGSWEDEGRLDSVGS